MAKKLHDIMIVKVDPNVEPYDATDSIVYIVWADVQEVEILRRIKGVIWADNDSNFPRYASRIVVECDPRYDQEELKAEIFNALATYIPGGKNG